MAKTKKVRGHAMTLKEFLREMRATRNGWKLRGDCIRSGRKTFLYCPITRVAHHRAKKRFMVVEVLKAASIIGLPNQLARRIVAAADEAYGWGVRRTLRRRLLAAVGLKEAEV